MAPKIALSHTLDPSLTPNHWTLTGLLYQNIDVKMIEALHLGAV